MLSDEGRVDVTVIGAGIVGICCALSLVERGLSVKLVDRSEPGSETSFGNAGIISPWSIVPQSMPKIWRNVPKWLLDKDGPVKFRLSSLPEIIPWTWKFFRRSNEEHARQSSDGMDFLTSPSVDLYRRHLKGTGQEHLVQDSMYVQAFRKADQPRMDALEFKIREEKGADLELIGSGELKQLEPALSSDFQAAVLIKGQARALAPGEIATVLFEKALQKGTQFSRTEVEDICPDDQDGWRVNTSGGSILSSKIVLSAGIWSSRLLAPLGYRLPLIAERGYHVEYPNSGLELNNSIMDVDNKIVASSMLGGVRVAGTSEFASIDAPADKSRYASLKKLTKAMLPALNTENEKQWMGRRPSFPDSLPVLGELPLTKGLYGAFGHSHYGLMMAPKTGEVIADLISGTNANYSLEKYSADRFGKSAAAQ